MKKILIPVDGSASANRAVQQVIDSAAQWKEMPEIHLLNVQWKLASANVKLFVSQDTLNDYYREQGMAALAGARAMLDAAGLPYCYHLAIGTPAETIIEVAREQQVDGIVLSARGQGGLGSVLLGSTVAKVIHLTSVPVLVVK